MLPESGDMLIFEIRDDAQFKTSFFMLDLETMDWKLEKLTFEEEWWIGVTYAADNLVLFHTFENEKNPDIKKYFLYDLAQDNILWELHDLVILNVNGFIAEVLNPESEEIHFLYLESLKPAHELTELETTKNKSLIHSFHYVEGSDYFETVKKFLKGLMGVEILNGVDYFQGKNRVIISYFIQENEKLANNLLVLDSDRETLLHEILGAGLSGISDNTFFIYNDNLIFVKE